MDTDVPLELDETRSSVARMLRIFDVEPVDGPVGDPPAAGRGPRQFVGTSDGGGRGMVDGSQVLGQAIVAAAKAIPGLTVRSAHATFVRMVASDELIDFDVEVVHAGRTIGTAIVRAGQRDRTCVTVSVLLDQPSEDVIRHEAALPAIAGPADAHTKDMPMVGRELRLVDVVDVNDPDEVGPPIVDAWLHYDPIPARDDLAKALLAHFTGHLSISTTMRPHAGVGTAQAHVTISTGVMAIAISFHEPVTWDDWILYRHESTQVGAGMSYVRGQIFTDQGHLLASFSQDGMIRPMAARTADDREVKHRL